MIISFYLKSAAKIHIIYYICHILPSYFLLSTTFSTQRAISVTSCSVPYAKSWPVVIPYFECPLNENCSSEYMTDVPCSDAPWRVRVFSKRRTEGKVQRLADAPRRVPTGKTLDDITRGTPLRPEERAALFAAS